MEPLGAKQKREPLRGPQLTYNNFVGLNCAFGSFQLHIKIKQDLGSLVDGIVAPIKSLIPGKKSTSASSAAGSSYQVNNSYFIRFFCLGK